MRVTQNMMSQQFLYNLTNLNTTMLNQENQISTGKTLNLPSDNPLGVSQDMQTSTLLSQSNGYTSTISQGMSWMQNTNSVMQEVSQSLQSIQTDVMQALNSPNQSQSGLQALSSSVQEYAQQVFTLLNTQQGDQYLFGGTSGNAAPVTTTGGSGVGYTLTNAPGVTGSIQYQVAQGVEISINVNAYSILGAPLSGSSSTATLQSTLQQVSQDMASGTSSNLENDLQNLTAAMGNVTNQTADLGARMQRMTAIQTQMSQYTTTLTNVQGDIVDANMAQVITQFNTDQISYQAALQMGSQILLPTLVSYLPSG